MPNKITYRIHEASNWFIKEGEPGKAVEFSDTVRELTKLIPSFAEVLSGSDPLSLIQNLTKKFGLRKGVEIAMLVTGTGGTPLRALNQYFVHLGIFPIQLHASLLWNGQTYNISRELREFGTSNVSEITHKNFESLGDPILEDLLYILCFGYATNELGYFYIWRRCSLGSLCGMEIDEISSKLIMGIIRGHPQIQGRENVTNGDMAEQKVRNMLQEIINNSDGWLRFEKKIPWLDEKGKSKPKHFDIGLKISYPGPWFSLTPAPPPQYIAIEVAWQETGNSVIHRKKSEYEEKYRTAKELGHCFCLVIDGVGYFSRGSSMDALVTNAHCAVGLADSELEILREFIEYKISAYRNQFLEG